MNPQKPWLDDYVTYAQGFTDAPTVFHRYVGLTILGSAMGNRWKMPNHEGGYDHPNLWTLLIAKSGTLHKSTAAKIGLRVADGAEIPQLASYGSIEALAPQFIKTPYGVIYADEFSDFLRGLGRDYTAGRGFFASLYDGIIMPQVFKNGFVKATFNVAATFLSCTTISWLTAHMTEADIEGGLLPRFLLIPAWKSDREPMDVPPTILDESVKKRLAAGLQWVSGQEHTCRRSAGADLLYRAWIRRMRSSPLDGTRGESWPARIAASCHKLSMIYHASRGGLDGVISEKDMQAACATCTEVLSGVQQLLENELALTKVEKEVQSLRRVLENPQHQEYDRWVPHSTALRYCHMDGKQFHALLSTATQSDLIELGSAKRGNPPIRLKEREPGDEG